MVQCFLQSLAHGFTVFGGIADVGEHLCERLGVVDFHKLLVLRQILLRLIDVVACSRDKPLRGRCRQEASGRFVPDPHRASLM